MKIAIGIDLGGTFIKSGLVDKDGRIAWRPPAPADTGRGREEIVARIKVVTRGLLDHAAGAPVVGIGIGTPGLVDGSGALHLPPNLPELDGLPMAAVFRDAFGLPVTVENDVNAFTWGEFMFGAGKPFQSIVCITLGTGLGGGVVLNGRLLRGGRYSAMEIGHTTIDAHGPRCNCGSYGCIERFVGAGRIVERARALLDRHEPSMLPDLVDGDLNALTPEIISRAGRAGDALAARVWREVGADIGAMLAGMVNLFNPEALIIGGGIAQAGDALFAPIEATVRERAFAVLTEGLKILPASLGAGSGILAAGALCFHDGAASSG